MPTGETVSQREVHACPVRRRRTDGVLYGEHFHEEVQRGHSYVLGYTLTRLALQSSGLPATRRSKR
jgi:hypothetical protein